MQTREQVNAATHVHVEGFNTEKNTEKSETKKPAKPAAGAAQNS